MVQKIAYAICGDEGIRTHDPLLARQVLSQLSYTPIRPNKAWASSFYIRKIIFLKTGSHLFCHTVTSIVFSAVRVLTVVFGMGTGVTLKRIATGKVIKRFELFLSLELITSMTKE